MSEHKQVVDGSTCMSCWDDIDSSNYVEFKSSATSEWIASGFCQVCVDYLIKTQWELYTGALAKTTCKAEQRRLLKAGPPINLKDAKALPCPDEGEVHSLWYASDSAEHSAKLAGSLEGEVATLDSVYVLTRLVPKSQFRLLLDVQERTKFWNDQAQFYSEDEPEDASAAGSNDDNTTPVDTSSS